MKTIWKYEFKMDGRYPVLNQCLRMQEGAEIIDVQMQNDILCLWAFVDTEEGDENRFFQVFETGLNIRYNKLLIRHLKTVQQDKYVWHVYEVL